MNMETPADALTRQVAENLSKPTRRRPNFLLLEAEREQHAAEMVALLAEREQLQDRLARAKRTALALGIVFGFAGGAVFGMVLL